MRTFVALVLALVTAGVAHAQSSISGVIQDQSGAVVSGASVSVVSGSTVVSKTVTGPDGRFTLDGVPASGASLVVRAGGFAEKTQPLTPNGTIEVVLEPAGLFEAVTVTPTRTEQRLGEGPG